MIRLITGGLVATTFGVVLALPPAPASSEKGKEAFKGRCALCHGDDGKGNPSIARMMKVEFKAMDSEYVQKKSDEEIRTIILEGKGKMVPVRGLTDDQIRDIIAYIRSLDPGKR